MLSVPNDFSTHFCLRYLYILKSYFGFPGMKNREERSKHFFDSGPLMEEDEDLAVYEKVFISMLIYTRL